jgi:hypothetical protein
MIMIGCYLKNQIFWLKKMEGNDKIKKGFY